MDTSEREQARLEAQAAYTALLASLGPEVEASWAFTEVEQGCEAGWDYAEGYPNATEEAREAADRQAKVRGMGDGFRLSFVSAALGGVEGLLR